MAWLVGWRRQDDVDAGKDQVKLGRGKLGNTLGKNIAIQSDDLGHVGDRIFG
jgi:hypothetical protein